MSISTSCGPVAANSVSTSEKSCTQNASMPHETRCCRIAFAITSSSSTIIIRYIYSSFSKSSHEQVIRKIPGLNFYKTGCIPFVTHGNILYKLSRFCPLQDTARFLFFLSFYFRTDCSCSEQLRYVFMKVRNCSVPSQLRKLFLYSDNIVRFSFFRFRVFTVAISKDAVSDADQIFRKSPLF